METELRDLFRKRAERSPALDEPPAPVLRRAERRRFVNAAASVVGAAAVAVVILIALGSRSSTVAPPLTTTSPSEQHFDGTIRGWRVAPQSTLDDEGLSRDLAAGLQQVAPGCKATQPAATAKTELDFSVGRLPASLKSSHAPNISKWVCGEVALSVSAEYDFEDTARNGVAMLRVERYLMDKRIFGADIPSDRIGECTLRGLSSICLHPEDDASGRGQTRFLVIEDDSLDPFARVLLVTGDEIPYAEMIQIVEGIR